MLSYLAVSGSSRRTGTLIGIVAVFILGMVSHQASAADIMAPHSLTPRSAGTVADADLSEKGTVTTGLMMHGAESALSQEHLDQSLESTELLRDAHRGSAFLGLTLTNRMEFVLGVHGTYEHVTSEQRNSFLVADEEEERSLLNTTGQTAGARQTGFADASLLFKIGVVRKGDFRFSVAPFIESGAGETATYSLTRSVAPKAGWMTMSTYGQKGIALVSLNTGYRYRNPEAIGNLTLRNEIFYKGSVRGYATSDLSFFVAADARKIMVNRDDERDDAGKLRYVGRETGAWNVGATAEFQGAEWTASYGGRFKQAKGFGFGDRSFGIAVAYNLGNVEGRRPRPSFADEVKREMKREESAKMKAADADAETDKVAADAELDKTSAKADTKTVKEEPHPYPEMIGTEIDPLDLFADDKDDFTEVEKRLAEEQKKTEGVSPDQQVEDELVELKQREKEEAKAEEKRAAEEAEVARAKARKDAATHSKKMKEWMEEANDELDDYQGISDEEMNWNGLED